MRSCFGSCFDRCGWGGAASRTAAAPLALIFNGVGFGFLRFPDLCVRCTRVIRGGRGRASRPFLRFPVRPPPLRAREVLPLPGRMVPRLGPPHALGRRLRGALARRPRLGRGLRGEARLALPAEARPSSAANSAAVGARPPSPVGSSSPNVPSKEEWSEESSPSGAAAGAASVLLAPPAGSIRNMFEPPLASRAESASTLKVCAAEFTSFAMAPTGPRGPIWWPLSAKNQTRQKLDRNTVARPCGFECAKGRFLQLDAQNASSSSEISGPGRGE